MAAERTQLNMLVNAEDAESIRALAKEQDVSIGDLVSAAVLRQELAVRPPPDQPAVDVAPSVLLRDRLVQMLHDGDCDAAELLSVTKAVETQVGNDRDMGLLVSAAQSRVAWRAGRDALLVRLTEVLKQLELNDFEATRMTAAVCAAGEEAAERVLRREQRR